MSVKTMLGLTLALLCATVQAVTVQHWQQPDGAQIYFVESRSIPILDVRVDFDAGSRRDSKPGVAALTAGLLDNGSAEHDEEAIRTRSADLAISLGAFGGVERAGMTLRTLADPASREPALALMAELLARPSFPAAVLAREKARSIDGLKQRESSPGYVADRTLRRLIYPEHPYGNEARLGVAELFAITRQDLLAFWRRHYQPRYAVVSIVGAVDRAEAARLAERLLAGLYNRGPALPPIPPVPVVAPREQRLANPASQAHLRLGMPLIARDDPDYYALTVGNYVLGAGGFDARLMQELRVKRGLTYGVSSSIVPMEQAGPFAISLSTRKDQADQALALARATLQRFIDEGPSEAELAQAKANLIGGFPLRIDSNRKLLGYLALIGDYQLPLDFLDRYPGDVAALTTAQIRDAWRRRVDPAALSTVVIGATATP